MATTNDNLDTSREQYISHKLYLEKRAGNRYYNLGYMMYKQIQAGTAPADVANLKNAIINFEISLLFNKNDVDARARINDLCKKYNNSVFDNDNVNNWKEQAKKDYRNCKC